MNAFSLFVGNVNDTIFTLFFYIDDIILTGNSIDGINKVKEFLKSIFLIKDLG